MKLFACILALLLAPLSMSAQLDVAMKKMGEVTKDLKLTMSREEFQTVKPKLNAVDDGFRYTYTETVNADGIKDITYYFDKDGTQPLYELIIGFKSPVLVQAAKTDLGPSNHPTEPNHWVMDIDQDKRVQLLWFTPTAMVMASNLPETEWDGDAMFILPDNFGPQTEEKPTEAALADEEVILPELAPIKTDPNAKAQLIFPETHYAEVSAFTPDEKMLISAGYGQLKFWDAEGGALYKTILLDGQTSNSPRNTNGMAVSSDGKWAVVVESEQLFLINLHKMSVERKIDVEGDAYEYAIFTPNGKDIFVAGYQAEKPDNYFLKKANVATGFVSTVRKWVVSSLGSHRVGHLSLSPDASQIIIWDGVIGSWLINLSNNFLQKATGPEQSLLTYLPNGHILATAGTKENKFNLVELDPQSWKPVGSSATVFEDDGNGLMWFSTAVKTCLSGRMMFVMEDTYRIFDPKTFSLSGKLSIEKPELGMLNGVNVCFSPSGKSFVSSMAMKRFNSKDASFRQHYGISSYRSARLANMGALNGVLLDDRSMLFEGGGLRVKRITPPVPDADVSSIFRLKENAKGGYVATDGVGLFQFDYENGPKNYAPLNVDGHTDIRGIRLFEKAGLIGLLCAEEALLYDINSNSIKQRFPFEEEERLDIFEQDEDYFCDLSPDGTKFLFKGGFGDNESALCYDVASGKKLWSAKAGWSGNFRFEDGGKNASFTYGGDVYSKRNATTGAEISKNDQLPQTDWYVTISPSGKTAITQLSNNESGSLGEAMAQYDMVSRRIEDTLKGHQFMVWNVLFRNNERYLLTQGEDFRLWDLKTHKEVARITLLNDSEDWVVFAPDGRFDASSGALEVMYFVKGREIIPLESLYEGFYTPNLLGQLLSGKDAPPAPVDINKLHAPPNVKMLFNGKQRNLEVSDDEVINSFESSSNTGTILIEADCSDDRVAEIRLYQNGKLLENSTRNLSVEDDVPNGNKLTKSFTVNILPGENRFKAVALNSQRTESRPVEILVKYKPANNPATPDITLHLVVVGINAYKNPKYNLNYALADATGIKAAFGKDCGKLISRCDQQFVSNEQAVKTGILTALDKVAANAKAQDIFILYYAGHGVMTEPAAGAGSGEFFLVPHDVTQLYGNDGALAQKGISATELKAYAQKIKAQKQLFILDACQSSGALDAVAARGAAEEKAIAQLARSTGTHWLTAAGSEQFASEFTQLGHGVFTYALLQGLGGNADGNNDGRITVKELDAYLQDIVPELTQKYKGTPQYPASYGFGQDFPVGLKQ